MSTRAAEAAFKRAQSRHSKSGNQCHHFTYHRLTCDQYDELLARAGGHCEMCKMAESETGGQRLVVDHFQSSQPRIRAIRGMVCDACNSAMSCLDGNKRWGPRRDVLEPRARAYQARTLLDLPLAELAAIERVQGWRQAHVARPPHSKHSREKTTDERHAATPQGAERMTNTIRRRSLPDSLRWLADKLEADSVSDADRAGVAVTLHALADEIAPPFEACGAPNYSDRCELDAGHDGRHKDGNASWPQGVERPVGPARSKES